MDWATLGEGVIAGKSRVCNNNLKIWRYCIYDFSKPRNRSGNNMYGWVCMLHGFQIDNERPSKTSWKANKGWWWVINNNVWEGCWVVTRHESGGKEWGLAEPQFGMTDRNHCVQWWYSQGWKYMQCRGTDVKLHKQELSGRAIGSQSHAVLWVYTQRQLTLSHLHTEREAEETNWWCVIPCCSQIRWESWSLWQLRRDTSVPV